MELFYLATDSTEPLEARKCVFFILVDLNNVLTASISLNFLLFFVAFVGDHDPDLPSRYERLFCHLALSIFRTLFQISQICFLNVLILGMIA